MTATLQVRNLSKRFGGIIVADDIHIDLPSRRVLGLIGPNGAGKTSLFNLITGIVRPDAGSVLLDGEPLGGLRVHQRARRGLSRTWQHVRLFPSLTVLDNLVIAPREYAGDSLFGLLLSPRHAATREAEARDQAGELLAAMGLAAFANTPAADLTYGQQKLVGVARALMNKPRCLLLDEPMAGVEGRAYQVMQKVIRDLAESGVAVCVVEHNVAFVRDLCDEGVFMFSGRILASGPVEGLMADPHLTELYFGT